MSSFFTVPTSQRKRKRADGTADAVTKKRNLAPRPVGSQNSGRRREERESSITESDTDEEGDRPTTVPEVEDDDTDLEDETAAQRRLRLAERYLDNLKEAVDEAGFDAAEIDKDLIAERLKEDVAAKKGKLYRRIASGLALETALHTAFRGDSRDPLTGIAVCAPHAYVVSKGMRLAKWELPQLTSQAGVNGHFKTQIRIRPKRIKQVTGDRHRSGDSEYLGHTAAILCVAVSDSGQFIVTGGQDRRIVVWNADLKPLKVFAHHRDSVFSVAFRQRTHQLYSASADRTVKVWSLDELAYVETLFGHQDHVVDVATLAQERCVSVGARDRTARLWKVVEESQLVFRGGGSGSKKGAKVIGEEGLSTEHCAEGSIDRVIMIDEDTFVTGSDNGSLCLWSAQKKKPVFTYPLAHGMDPPLKPEEASAELYPAEKVPAPPQARWITALATIPYSDVFFSASWNGQVKAWRISEDKRKIESLGAIGQASAAADQMNDVAVAGASTNGHEYDESKSRPVRGVVNDLAVYESGETPDKICVLAAVASEQRSGRWSTGPGVNSGHLFVMSRHSEEQPAAQ